MCALPTSEARSAHAYTRSKSPWILTDGAERHGRLAHYLSGGGLRTFGRTVRQEEIRLRQRRFWFVAGALAALWLALWIF